MSLARRCWTFFLALLCGCSLIPLYVSHAADAGLGRVKFRHAYFEIELPKGWRNHTPQGSQTPLYLSPQQRHRVTITIALYKQYKELDEEVLLFEYAQNRFDHELDSLGRKDSFDFTEPIKTGDFYQCTFVGEQKAKKRQFTGLMIMRKGKVITFYVESFDRPEAEHAQIAQITASTAVVK